jgi:hypothetical protein
MMAVIAQRVTKPAPRPAIPWAVAPRRVVWPQRRRSHLPLSSSPRSNRVLVSSPQMAPRIMSVMETLKTVKPVTVWSWGAGPNRPLTALLVP